MLNPSRSTWFSRADARRSLMALLLLGLLLSLGACQGDPPTITPATRGGADAAASGDDTAADAPAVETEPLSIEVLNSELALGLERFSFLIKDADGGLVRDGEVSVRFNRILPQTGEAKNAASGEALYFGTGMPHGGSWIAYTDFDASGPWDLEVDIVRASGARGSATLDVEVDGKTDSPRVGQRPPTTDVPRMVDGADVAELTSDEGPTEAFYTLSLDEALANGKPSVIYLGSPAHCRTDACKASLQSMKSVFGGYSDRVNFLHFETRDPSDPSAPSAAMRAWGLPSEPWFFILDSRGLVQSRIEGAIDVTELDLLVRRSLGQEVTQPQQ